MEISIQTTVILIEAIDLELKALLQNEVAVFKAAKQTLHNDNQVA